MCANRSVRAQFKEHILRDRQVQRVKIKVYWRQSPQAASRPPEHSPVVNENEILWQNNTSTRFAVNEVDSNQFSKVPTKPIYYKYSRVQNPSIAAVIYAFKPVKSVILLWKDKADKCIFNKHTKNTYKWPNLLEKTVR